MYLRYTLRPDRKPNLIKHCCMKFVCCKICNKKYTEKLNSLDIDSPLYIRI